MQWDDLLFGNAYEQSYQKPSGWGEDEFTIIENGNPKTYPNKWRAFWTSENFGFSSLDQDTQDKLTNGEEVDVDFYYNLCKVP